MSMNRHKDGLFWPSFFYPSLAQDIDSTNKRLQEQINSIRQNAQPYNGQHFIQEMLEYAHISSREWFIPDNPIPLLACERVALRFMLEDSSFAADFLTEEELEKAKATFARGQYTSGLMKKLLKYFSEYAIIIPVSTPV